MNVPMPMQDLLLQSQRINGTRRPITVIEPENYDEFFQRLKALDTEPEFKAYLAVSLSGGLRVSEALSLRVASFNWITGTFNVRVLKKRSKVPGKNGELNAHKVYREARLHPLALEIVKDYLETQKFRNYDYLFKMDRFQIDSRIKKHFGPKACAHSMARHSHITWLLQQKKEPELAVARIMEINPRIVASYNHLNRTKELEKLYSDTPTQPEPKPETKAATKPGTITMVTPEPAPQLGAIKARPARNGFIVTVQNEEYIFKTHEEIGRWIVEMGGSK